MASFQAKTVRARLRKRKKKVSFRSVPNRLGIENSKKIGKKFKKLKNIKMASFQAKTGRERPRKREKKLSLRSVPTRPGIKNSKKIQNIKKHHYGFFSSQNEMGLAEKEKKNNRSNQLIPDQK